MTVDFAIARFVTGRQPDKEVKETMGALEIGG